MSDVKPIAPVRIGQTDILYAQGIRAGSWLFFTGHEATDFEHGIAAPVTGKPGQPLGGAPRYLREGRFIFDRFAKLIAAEGGDLRHIVREAHHRHRPHRAPTRPLREQVHGGVKIERCCLNDCSFCPRCSFAVCSSSQNRCGVMSAFLVAIGGKADMPFCGAHVCF
jgi:hypothetical protein